MSASRLLRSTAIFLLLLPALHFQLADPDETYDLQLPIAPSISDRESAIRNLTHFSRNYEPYHEWINCTIQAGKWTRGRQRRSHNRNSFTDYMLAEQQHISSALRKIGPYFESNRTSKVVKARTGHDVMLDCAVVLLQGRTVSWLRRKSGSVQLLTVGNQTYSSDTRLALHFRYPNNWRLGILRVSQVDEGEYQCQLSTHPPKALVFHLRVIAPAVQILDDNENVITERHYKVDSSLHLTCRALTPDKSIEEVTWYKGDHVLPGNDSRIKVKHSKNQTSGEATAFLYVHSVRKEDSGNYSCIASPQDRGTIVVHVLNEKHPEAVQYENSVNADHSDLISLSCFLLLLIVHQKFL